MLNLSNYTLNFSTPGQAIEISAIQLIQDFVTEIDQKIILGIVLIFIGYTLYALILPRSLKGLDTLKQYEVLDPIVDKAKGLIKFLISLSETFALGSSIFIFIIAYIKGIIPDHLLTISKIIIFLALLIGLIELIGFIRRLWPYNKTSKKRP